MHFIYNSCTFFDNKHFLSIFLGTSISLDELDFLIEFWKFGRWREMRVPIYPYKNKNYVHEFEFICREFLICLLAILNIYVNA